MPCTHNGRTVRVFVVSVACGLSWIGLLTGLDDPLGNKITDSTVVATVNVTPIKYSAISVSWDVATKRFVLETGRAPAGEEDLRRVDQIRKAYEAKNLANYIRGTIRNQQVSAFGITVSDAEIKHRWETLVLERDPPATRAASHHKLSVLLSCVQAVHEQSENADRVYKESLTDIISSDEWRLFLQQYESAERRRQLKHLLGSTERFDADAKSEVRFLLFQEKLNKAVEEELVRSDPEFEEYMRLAKSDPDNKKVQEKGVGYLLERRSLWWQQRYKDATVVFRLTQFNTAWMQPCEP